MKVERIVRWRTEEDPTGGADVRGVGPAVHSAVLSICEVEDGWVCEDEVSEAQGIGKADVGPYGRDSSARCAQRDVHRERRHRDAMEGCESKEVGADGSRSTEHKPFEIIR